MRILAFSVTHDSAVCSVNDGKLEFFCKEERLSRVKRDKHPFKALNLFKDLNFGKVDHALFVTPSNNNFDMEWVYSQFIQKTFGVELENYSSLLHHTCHASLAFFNSGFEECLVFVIDRNGSLFFLNNDPVAREAESVFACKRSRDITPIYKSFTLQTNQEWRKEQIADVIADFYPSAETKINTFGIVKVYEAATTLIGQHALENGKTMGLASYGEDKKYSPLFHNGVAIASLFSEVAMDGQSDQVCFYGESKQIIKDVPINNYQYYANRAKQVQIETQHEVFELIKKYVAKTGIQNVCLVGGYGLNVVANNYYLKNLPDVNFYFEPVADDTGTSIGAAYLKHVELLGDKNIKPLTDNFYHYHDTSEQVDAGIDADIDDLCRLLIDQKSVAIFDGAPEAGARALGHRSILYDPRNKNSKDNINKVKQREWYRPFAGVILESEFKKYFDTTTINQSEYMTINFDAKQNAKELISGVIHVDGTCRVQTIASGFMYELLTRFYELTGCPMLLNTSFNLAGEPLVQTKKDAISVLERSCLDAVYFVDEEKLIKKEITC